MRILHVNKFFDMHGGAEVYLHGLMDRQRQQGHEVHVFATRKPGTRPHPDEAWSPTYHAYDKFEGVGAELAKGSLLADATKALSFIWNREARRQFAAMVEAVRPDVVHLHNLYHHLSSSILAEIRARKLPCVQTLHDYKLACPNYKMFTQGSPCERCQGGDYTQAIRNRCFSAKFAPNVLGAFEMHFTKMTAAYERTVHTFLCPSKFMQEKMAAWGEPAGKLARVPNPTAIPAAPATRGGGYVLYAGRLSEEKGLEVFLRGAARVPDVPVWIVGKGPQEMFLKRLVAELGASHVQFLPFKTPQELAEIRARAEAVVLPTRMYENASGVLLEGLAAGLPCLASNIGGNPELVEDGKSGWLVDPNDPGAWMRALVAFTQASPTRREEMGRHGRAFIQRERTWQGHLEKVQAIYGEAMSGRARAR